MTTTRRGTILVIDDEEIMREILETLLTRDGYEVRLASSGTEGLELARALPFDAAIVDIMMPGLDGIATLDELKRIDEDLAVVIITAYGSIESAIAAMKSGAFDYITKPFKNEEVLVVVRNAMERRRLVHENRTLRQNIQERYHKFANIIGRSPKMRQVFDLIMQAAPSRPTVRTPGDTRPGQGLAARDLDPAAAAQGAQGRHPAARTALPLEVRQRKRQDRPRAHPRRAGPADRLRLAGERPRA